MKKTVAIKSFTAQRAWRSWLAKNHATSDGVWLRFFRKSSGRKSLTHELALDEALCYGWIDGQVAKYDEMSWLQKFTPRRPKSMWSKRNRDHVSRLEREKRMKPAGLREVESAKTDGRLGMAYDSPKNMNVPADFMKELGKDKNALAFFRTLNKANTYAIGWRLQTAARPETRERRMKQILKMMSEGKKFH
jgi:uncharacterized protein YdeI (YjbR/CyaY-like superfamily)